MQSPLSPAMFIRRNLGKTVPLVIVITLAVMLVQSIISMINSIPLSVRTIYRYSDAFLGVSPRLDPEMTPRLVAILEDNPPAKIDRVILCRGSMSQVKSIVGKWPFAVMAMDPDDLKYYLKMQGMTGITGKLPTPGQAEMVISRPVATNLKIGIGQVLLKPDDTDNFSRQPIKVVGIVETSRWVMAADRAFYAKTQPIPIEFALLFTKDRSQQSKFDHWAEEKMKGQFAQVFAFHQVEKQSGEMFAVLYNLINAVIVTLVLVITFMMGMLMNIYQSQRLVEFGLLQAIGYTKSFLLKRVLIESVLVIIGGWILGLGVARLFLLGFKSVMMDPNGFMLDVNDRMALLYTVPIPFAILAVAIGTISFRFRKFDPVAVVERRLV